MQWLNLLVGGLAATAVLTTVTRVAQALGYTRMDIPFMLGTMVTADRDRAKVVGFVIHFTNGLIVAVLYAAVFHVMEWATWWLGALMGLAHGAFVLIVVLPLLPGGHPRMASEFWGPSPARLLEPPGFLALHYGPQTPLTTLIAHLGYGLVLGWLYQV